MHRGIKITLDNLCPFFCHLLNNSAHSFVQMVLLRKKKKTIFERKRKLAPEKLNRIKEIQNE